MFPSTPSTKRNDIPTRPDDPPPEYEEIDSSPITQNGHSSLREIRESLTRVRSALEIIAATEKWGKTDKPGKRDLCELMCRETRLSFAGMSNHQYCCRKLEYQWLEEDFLKVFVALFSRLRQTETEHSDIPLDVLLTLGRTLVAICPSQEGKSRDIASHALFELTRILSLLSFEKEVLMYEALFSNSQTSKFARYFLYLQLYKRMLQVHKLCQSGENADPARLVQLRDAIRNYVAREPEFTALGREFGSLKGKQSGETALPEELVKQLTAAVQSMNGNR